MWLMYLFWMAFNMIWSVWRWLFCNRFWPCVLCIRELMTCTVQQCLEWDANTASRIMASSCWPDFWWFESVCWWGRHWQTIPNPYGSVLRVSLTIFQSVLFQLYYVGGNMFRFAWIWNQIVVWCEPVHALSSTVQVITQFWMACSVKVWSIANGHLQVWLKYVGVSGSFRRENEIASIICMIFSGCWMFWFVYFTTCDGNY